jgi:hypothetical protein
MTKKLGAVKTRICLPNGQLPSGPIYISLFFFKNIKNINYFWVYFLPGFLILGTERRVLRGVGSNHENSNALFFLDGYLARLN